MLHSNVHLKEEVTVLYPIVGHHAKHAICVRMDYSFRQEGCVYAEKGGVGIYISKAAILIFPSFLLLLILFSLLPLAATLVLSLPFLSFSKGCIIFHSYLSSAAILVSLGFLLYWQQYWFITTVFGNLHLSFLFHLQWRFR